MRTILLEATIDELTPGGDGVAIGTIAGERRAIFVPGVAPGERVSLEVDPSRRPARARLRAVIEASADRVQLAPCAHLERCGGCDWMHLAVSAQAREHAAIVERLLGLAPARIHPAPRTEGARARARVHVAVSKRGKVVAGMFGRGTHEPAEVEACVVLEPVLDRARRALASWLEGARGSGEAQLALGAERRAVLDLRWRGTLVPEVYGRLERAVLEEASVLAGARVFEGDVRVPAVIGDPTPWLVGPDGAPLRFAPGGFAQASEEANGLLARRVAELVGELPPGPCVELYSGAGNLTVLLARDREVLAAVEQDRDACAAARSNLTARGLEAKVVEADASAWPIPKAARVVVLDPPRTGARAVVEALAKRGGKRPAVVYVACDPPTLARDVKTLAAAGWTLGTVETFEMFPHTSHVETVAVLHDPRECVARGTPPRVPA